MANWTLLRRIFIIMPHMIDHHRRAKRRLFTSDSADSGPRCTSLSDLSHCLCTETQEATKELSDSWRTERLFAASLSKTFEVFSLFGLRQTTPQQSRGRAEDEAKTSSEDFHHDHRPSCCVATTFFFLLFLVLARPQGNTNTTDRPPRRRSSIRLSLFNTPPPHTRTGRYADRERYADRHIMQKYIFVSLSLSSFASSSFSFVFSSFSISTSSRSTTDARLADVASPSGRTRRQGPNDPPPTSGLRQHHSCSTIQNLLSSNRPSISSLVHRNRYPSMRVTEKKNL